MHLTLGSFTLQLGRREKAGAHAARAHPPAPLAAVFDDRRSPFLLRHDNPTQNLSFIRETVSACMHARSEAIGRGRFRAYTEETALDGRVARRPLPTDHPLTRLLTDPNPMFDMSDLLELSSQWLDATGNALWLKVRDGSGRVVELWPLPALNFLVERGTEGSTAGLPEWYRFEPTNVRIPARDVIHIRRTDIRSGPWLGHAVLSDILETAKADSAIRLFQSRFFDNDAMPRAVLRWPAGSAITQDQMNELRSAWEAMYATPANAGRIGILSDGGEVQLLSNGTKELDFARSKKELRDTIREAFKVPQIVLGDVENVNLSNAETSYSVFLRDVVDHSLARHARAFTRSLAQEFNADRSIVIEHDSVVPENEEHFLGRLRELKDSLTQNEKRALLGMPPLPA